MKPTALAIMFLAGLALAGCGKKGPLDPPPGIAPLAAAATATLKNL